MNNLRQLYEFVKGQRSKLTSENYVDIFNYVLRRENAYRKQATEDRKFIPLHDEQCLSHGMALTIVRSLLMERVNHLELRANVKHIELEDGKYHDLPQDDKKVRAYHFNEADRVLKQGGKCLKAISDIKGAVYINATTDMPEKVSEKYVDHFFNGDMALIRKGLKHSTKPEQMSLI